MQRAHLLLAAAALHASFCSSGCAGGRTTSARSQAIAARLGGRCSPVDTTSAPRAAVAAVGPGNINLRCDGGPELARTLTHVRDFPLGTMNGSTVSWRMEIADTSDASPRSCVFTAVFTDTTCALEATGKRTATRTVTSFPPGQPDDAMWQLVVDVIDPSGCTAKRNLMDGERAVIVEGSWEDLRVVAFRQGLNFTGGEGSHGPLVDHEGKDLRPEIRSWPKDEQALYARGPGFSVWRSDDEDLFWFASLGGTNEPWAYRLRDEDGKLLLDRDVLEGRTIPLARHGTLLRHGSQLLHAGASGFRRVR